MCGCNLLKGSLVGSGLRQELCGACWRLGASRKVLRGAGGHKGPWSRCQSLLMGGAALAGSTHRPFCWVLQATRGPAPPTRTLTGVSTRLCPWTMTHSTCNVTFSTPWGSLLSLSPCLLSLSINQRDHQTLCRGLPRPLPAPLATLRRPKLFRLSRQNLFRGRVLAAVTQCCRVVGGPISAVTSPGIRPKVIRATVIGRSAQGQRILEKQQSSKPIGGQMVP